MFGPEANDPSKILNTIGYKPIAGTTKTLTLDQFRAAVETTGLSPQQVFESAKAQGYKIEGEEQVVNVYAQKQIEEVQQEKRKKELHEGGFLRNVIGAAADSTSGIADLGLTAVSNAAEFIARKTGNEDLANRMDAAEKKTKEQVGDVGQNEDSALYKVSKTIFDLEQLVAGSALVKSATKATKVGQLMGQLRNELGLAGKVGAGAIEGVADTAGFMAVSQGRLPTKGEVALGGAIGGVIPIAAAGLKWAAPKLQLSGLLNPKKFDDVKESLVMEGVDDAMKTKPEDVANRMFQRGVKGSKEQIIGQLDDIAKESKQTVDSILSTSTTAYAPPEAKKALQLMLKEVHSVEGLESYADDLAKLGAKIDDGKVVFTQESWSLSEINQIKRLSDDIRQVFKTGAIGDVKNGLKTKGLANIRLGIKKFIEDTAMQEGLAAGYEGNAVKILNNQTVIATELSRGIARKESSDAIREILQFMGGRTPGAIIGGGVATQVGGPFDEDTTAGKIGNILVGALLGGAMANTKIKTYIANAISKIPPKQQSEIYKWMLSDGTKELGKGAKENLYRIIPLFQK